MFKKLIAALFAFVAISAFAAVDVNTGSQAELESIKGIGPVISTLIINERKKGPFKDWEDMVVRVKGVGEGNAAKFSTDGLTVNGAAFKGAPAVAKPTKAAKVSATDEPKSGVAKAVDSTENGVKKGASATESGAKHAASATATGVKKAASATESGVTKAAKATKTKAGEIKDDAVEKKDAMKEDRAEKKAAKKAAKAASATK